MSEKGDPILCWCCENFLIRFDNNLTPNRITGGICINKRSECRPYDEICKSFSIKEELLPELRNLSHSADEYMKRHPEFLK